MKNRIDMPIVNCPYAIPFEPEFASETSAMFRLGYSREFVFEDLNQRMNARPTPPGFRRRRISGSCAGRCDNPSCEAPWDKETQACSAGCEGTVCMECATCRSNLAVRKSAKWDKRAFAMLVGYEAHGGLAALVTFKLPLYAVRPEHAAEYAAFKADTDKSTTELFVAERLPIARKNLEIQLERRREVGRPGLPVKGSDSYEEHRPLVFQQDEETWVRRVNAAAISTEDAAFEEAFEDLARDRASEYVRDNFDSLVQLYAYRQGWIQAVVESWNRYIPREPSTRGFNYICPDMLSSPIHFKATTEPVPADIEPERILPLLLSHMISLVEKRMREEHLPYQKIGVIEQGSKGGYHFHMLLCCLPVEGRMDAIERRLKFHLHRILGNVQWDSKVWSEEEDRYVTKSWFARFPVSERAKLSKYISKYISKGWIDTRVRSSTGLALSDVARDMSLQRQGFVPDRDLSQCWHPLYRVRRVKGSDTPELFQAGIAYRSPYSKELLDDAIEVGSDTWIILEFEDSRLFNKSEYMSAPKVVGMVLTAGPVASMLSAEFAIGISADLEELDTVPHGTVAVPVHNLAAVDDHERHSRLASLVFSDKKNQRDFGSPETFGGGDSRRQAQFLYYYTEQLKRMKTSWEEVHRFAAPGALLLHRLSNELAARSPPDHHLN